MDYQEKMEVTRVEQKAVAETIFDLKGESQERGKRGKMSMFEVTMNTDGDPMGSVSSRLGKNVPSRSNFWRWRRRKLIR